MGEVDENMCIWRKFEVSDEMRNETTDIGNEVKRCCVYEFARIVCIDFHSKVLSIVLSKPRGLKAGL